MNLESVSAIKKALFLTTGLVLAAAMAQAADNSYGRIIYARYTQTF